MRVPLDLDARDDARGDRDALAALGVADDAHLVLKARHLATLERRHALPEARLVDLERREVALVRDLHPSRDVLARVSRLKPRASAHTRDQPNAPSRHEDLARAARLADLDVRRIGDDVRIRQHAPAGVGGGGEAGAARLFG